MERDCAWMMGRLLVALLLLQGFGDVAGQTATPVDCTNIINKPDDLVNAIYAGQNKSSDLLAYPKQKFACLNATTISHIAPADLAALFDMLFLVDPLVASTVMSNVAVLQNRGDVLAAIVTNTVFQNVSAALMSVVWPGLNASFSTMPEANITSWFTKSLRLLLPAINASQIPDIPINVSCVGFTPITQSLDNVYPVVSDDTKRAVVDKVKAFIKQDPCCASGINSNSLLVQYFRRYRKNAAYAEFVEVLLDFTGFDNEYLLTTIQLADFAATDNALPFVNTLTILPFTNITDLEIFVDEFNIKAAGKTVSKPGQVFLMNLACPAFNLNNLTDAEVNKWFVTKLLPFFLPGITARCLNQLFPSFISCTHFITILGSLNQLFYSLDTDTNGNIAMLINTFILSKPNCSPAITSISLFTDYFGNFSQYLSYSQLCSLPPFDAEAVLPKLTPVQLADYSARYKTLTNETKLLAVFANNLNDINAVKIFVDTFTGQAMMKQLPDGSRAVLLQGVWDKLILNLPTMNDSLVLSWFDQSLPPKLLPGITPAQVASIPVSITCQSFNNIMKGLDKAYTTFNDTVKVAVVAKIKEFVKAVGNSTCTIDSVGLIGNYLKQFNNNITYAELIDIFPTFYAESVLMDLTVNQLADFAATDNVLNDTVTLGSILKIISRDSFGPFLDEFNIKAAGKTVPKASQVVLMQIAWPLVGPNLTTMSDADVSKWFVSRLSPNVLPGTTNVQADTMPVSLSCSAFTTIIKSFSAVYTQLSDDVKSQVLKEIKNFVTPAVKSSKCTPPISNNNLLTDYFGQFRNNAVDADFIAVFPSYIPVTSAKDFGDYAASDTVLNDAPALAKIFTNLNDLPALGVFLDEFNLQAAGKTVPKASQAVLMQGSWNKLSPVNALNDNDVKTWFVTRLSPLILPGITAANVAALPTTMLCSNFAFLVGKLDAGLSSDDAKQSTYTWVTSYLKAAKQATLPGCYDNKNSWIADYMGQSFLRSKLSDLNGLVPDSTMREKFVIDKSTLNMLNAPNNMELELRLYLVQTLNKSGLNFTSMPTSLLCTYVGAFPNTSVGNSSLSACLHSITDPIHKEQVSLNLLSTYADVGPASIEKMGSAVVFLSLNTINNKLDSNSTLAALGALSNQSGWNPGQAQIIVRKLREANFTVNTADSLIKLGGLVSGVPSNTFTNLDPLELRNFTIKGNASNVATIPDGVQSVIVNKLLTNQTLSINLVKELPPTLLSHIPIFHLNNLIVVSAKDLSKGQWSEAQALVLMGNLMGVSNSNLTDIIGNAPNLLPGFQCADLKGQDTAKSFVTLISANGLSLSPTQASCLASGLSSVDLDQNVPSSVLIYVDANKFSIESPACIPLFTSLGKADINKLPKDKSRTNLLSRALLCLNKATGPKLAASDVAVLGNLSCELSGDQISNADLSVLDNLKQCRVYSTDQANVIQTKLGQKYGSSSTWTYENLRYMGDMVTTLNNAVLNGITSATVLNALVQYVTAQTQAVDTSPDRLRFPPNLTAIQARLTKQAGGSITRRKRATTACSGNQLSRQDILSLGQALALKTANDLDGCISDVVFGESVDDLGKLSFSPDQLAVFKSKLKRQFSWPTPTTILSNIGNLALAFTPDEIQVLDLTSIDVVGKLSKTKGWTSDQIKAVTNNYLNGKTVSQLTSSDLRSLGVFVTGISDLSVLDQTAFTDAVEALGSIDKYNLTQLQALWKKANDTFKVSFLQQWPAGTISALGTIIAGASAVDINNMTVAQKAEIKQSAIPLIPLNVFSGLSAETIRALSFPSLIAITNDQYRSLSPTISDILNIRMPTVFSTNTTIPSAGSGFINVPSIVAPSGAQGVRVAMQTLAAAMILPHLCMLLS